MGRVIVMRDDQRGHLIAEAVTALLDGKETNVQYKHTDQIDWRTPTLQTQMVVFISKSIEWRHKPEPSIRYYNMYVGGFIGEAYHTHVSATDNIDKSQVIVGMLIITFEDDKDPVFEFVKA